MNTNAVIARITVFERECDESEYETENGRGFPDNAEPYETNMIEVHWDGESNPDDCISLILDHMGLRDWDGGSTAYDQNGVSMDLGGRYSERFANIERF